MRFAVLLVIAVTAVGLPACGGDDGGGGGGDDAAEIRTLFSDFWTAFKAADGEKVCSLMTEEAQKEAVEDAEALEVEGDPTCPNVMKEFAAFAGLIEGEPKLEDVQVDGDRATGTSVSKSAQEGGGTEREPQAFEKVDGEWKLGPSPDGGDDAGGGTGTGEDTP
jgi:ketosteroid isomerase-like protein